ncbi:MAG: ABC transporter permease [Bacteriovoracaceae bacterium]
MTSINLIFNNFYIRLVNFLIFIGETFFLSMRAFHASLTRPFYFQRMVEQIVILGVGSISITIVIGLTMGLVMTLQFGWGLAKFGGTLYIPGIVSLSLTREMAPIFTSLLVAGRIGSGMAAEIGSMNVTSQIDAIRALGTSPVRVLIVPRLIASMISLPLLTLIADFMGLLGGLIISVYELGIPASFYFSRVLTTIKIADVTTGLAKTVFFAIIITILACYKGLNTKDGTRGVGKSTTWVVVMSSINILIFDFFIGKIFLLLFMK